MHPRGVSCFITLTGIAAVARTLCAFMAIVGEPIKAEQLIEVSFIFPPPSVIGYALEVSFVLGICCSFLKERTKELSNGVF